MIDLKLTQGMDVVQMQMSDVEQIQTTDLMRKKFDCLFSPLQSFSLVVQLQNPVVLPF